MTYGICTSSGSHQLFRNWKEDLRCFIDMKSLETSKVTRLKTLSNFKRTRQLRKINFLNGKEPLEN